jgi:Iap family predicted aminopeptidase
VTGRATKVLIALATLLLVATVSAAAVVETSAAPSLRISTVEDIRADLGLLGCGDESRYESVSRLFTKAGAPSHQVEDFSHREVRNLVVRKAGASAETIVVGAHYDKTELGCGAVDNWTGIVALAHLYSTFREVVPAKSLLFVAFDDEELGLLGSHAMVRSIPKRERARYCAMINLDSFGLTTPQVLDNASSARLRKLAGELAETLDVPFDHARVDFADADSTAFLRRGIPAITLHGLSADGLAILHTDRDQPARVNATSVYLGYRLALALLARVDGMACDAFR